MIYTIDEISSRIRPVAEKYHLKAVYLFGSYARGEARDDSDVDLLVDLSGADLSGFFAQINASGESSARLLQNLCIPGSRAQAVPLALALSAKLLGGRGAARVHGGGFGGTVLAFVPADLREDYISLMNRTFGENAALCLSVRSLPACRVI